MRAEQARCGQCGAALPLSGGPVVVCGYCGRESRLVVSHSPAPVPGASLRAQAASGPRSPVLWLVLGGVAVLGATLAVIIVGLGVRRNVGSPPVGTAATPATDPKALRFWHTRDVALLGAEGAAASVAGIAGSLNGATFLTVLAGETGRPRWQVAAQRGLDVYADGGHVLLTFDPAKKVTRYDAKTGSVLWSITVAGPVHDITFGPNCAAILLGGEPLGIDTDSGRHAACRPARTPLLARYKLEPGDVRFTQGELEIVGGLELDSAPINPAPPRFALSASRADKPLWRVVPASLEPVWTSDGFHRTVALTPAGVFVFGRDSSSHHARWLLLELGSGRAAYERTSAAKVEGRVRVVAGGSVVFVSHDHDLDVIRVADGELAWRIGG